MVNPFEKLPSQPIEQADWNQMAAFILRLGGSYIEIRRLDDVAPDGSADTACQQNHEKAIQAGQVVIVKKNVLPGISSSKTYRIFPPKQ